MDKLRILLSYIYAKSRKTFKTREDLELWQDKKVKAFLEEIVPLSSFYSEQYKGLCYKDWRSFPVMDKKMMMENFDRLNTVGINKGEAFRTAFEAENSKDFSPTLRGITIGLSSGTSGNRGLFLASKKERGKWAGTILGKVLPGSILSSHKIAFFLRANSNLYNTISGGKIEFEFFDLLKSMNSHIEKLNAFTPTILVAPPSMLKLLAEAKENGILKIAPIKIISVAEVLDPLDEQYLRVQFNQIIHQIYQCTEGFLATTCEYGTLHVNEDFLVIQKEYINRGLGKFIPIITDFTRTSQPILRYRLNDILTEQKIPCPCGSKHLAIKQIEGRCDELNLLELPY